LATGKNSSFWRKEVERSTDTADPGVLTRIRVNPSESSFEPLKVYELCQIGRGRINLQEDWHIFILKKRAFQNETLP